MDVTVEHPDALPNVRGFVVARNPGGRIAFEDGDVQPGDVSFQTFVRSSQAQPIASFLK